MGIELFTDRKTKSLKINERQMTIYGPTIRLVTDDTSISSKTEKLSGVFKCTDDKTRGSVGVGIGVGVNVDGQNCQLMGNKFPPFSHFRDGNDSASHRSLDIAS